MYGIKAVLTFGLLLTAADARPEGYGGVKGGRNHKSPANAFASAQATANADGGYLGAAQSSASATAQSFASATAQSSASATAQSSASANAIANAFANGGSSNAAATANAYADGGNIGKVIWSDDANGNANPLGDSDNLRLSSAHAKDSENQSDNQEDGTSIGSHHNAHTGSYGNGGSVGLTGQGQDHRPGCGVTAGVKGHRGASGCTGGNGAEENKPSGSNAHPAYNGNPDSSAGSKYPTSLDGSYGGNNAGAQPCTSGASGCPKNKPSVSNPYPAYNGNPDLSTGSNLDGGYGGDNAGAQPCTSGASGCPKNKPSVSNPYPTYNGNPDSSAGSNLDGGYGGNHAGAQPCTSGASGCPKNKPSVSNPHPTYNGNPDLSGGSKYPTNLDGDYGGNNAGAQPCTSGASGCPKNKPSVSNPYPTYNGNPDLSAGSKYPTSLDGGYGSNIAKPEPPSCSGGAPGCSGNKPSVSNPHAVYPGFTDSSPDSQHKVDINHGQVEGHAGKPQDTPCFPGDPRCLVGSKPKPTTPDPSTAGTIQYGPIPCTSGSINCPHTKPSVANTYPTHQENPDLSGGSKYPTNPNGGYGGKTPTAGEHPSSGSSHYPGSSGKPDTSNPFLNGEIDVSDIKDSVNTAGKINPENPFLNPHSQVRPSTDTKHPVKPNGSYGGSPTAPVYPHGGSGDSTSPTIKTNPSNPFLSHNGNVDSSNHVQQNTNLNAGQGHPATNGGCHGSTGCGSNKPGYPTGSSEYPVNKPNPANPFLSHTGNVDSTYGINHPGAGNGFPQNTNFPNSQGHPATNGGCHGSTGCGSNKPGSSEYPVNKPNPANPFLSHNGNVDSTNHEQQNTNLPTGQGHPATNGGCHGSTGCGSNKPGYPTDSSEYPVNKPNPANPFLSHNGNVDSTNHEQQNTNLPTGQGHPATNGGCHGSTGCGSNKPGHPTGPSEYPVNKPNPANPFLSHNGNVDSTNHEQQNTNVNTAQGHPATNGGCHGSTGCGSNKPGYPTGSSEYPANKPNPANPFLSHNGNVDSPNHEQQNTNLPSGQGHPATNGGCHGSTGCGSNKPGYPTGSSEYPVNKPNPANPFLSHNGNVDSTYGINHPGVGSGFPQNTNLPTSQGHPATNGGCHGSTGCGSNEPGHPTGSSEYPVNKPNPSNPSGTKYPDLKPPVLKNPGSFGESSYDLIDPHSNDKHPGAGNGYPQNTNLPTTQGHPATNGGCHGSTGCGSNEPGHPTGSSEYPLNKPNPSNPTGTKYPDLKPPLLKNPGSFGESSYDLIDPHSHNKNHGSQDLPSMYPGKESTGSNPDLGDGQLTNPHPKPGSHDTPNSPKPFPGHGNGYHGNGNPYGTEDQVKTHQPGVKGGSRRREPPAKLQESELLSGNTGSAYSAAHASASASAHSSAYASSSSSSGGGHSSAKSDAYSDFGSSGSSNSWASSSASASASASAFASSSSHQGPESWQFPDVPAE